MPNLIKTFWTLPLNKLCTLAKNARKNYLQGWLGDPHESGDETFLSSNEMDSRPLGSSEQFSGIISSEPDFSIILAGGASRSISISDESEVDAAAFKEPEKIIKLSSKYQNFSLLKVNKILQ